MIVAVQGTSSFDDYSVFLRAMGVALSSMPDNDKEFLIYSAGPIKINSMVSEFSNISEKGLKSRGKKLKNYKVAPSWLSENMEFVDYFVYLSKPKESVSKLVSEAQLKNIEVGIYRY